MPNLAAIDIGSNGIRLVVARPGDDGKLEILESRREPIRLGRDVFGSGLISDETVQRCLPVFDSFKQTLQSFAVDRVRAVATSAMREARNGPALIDTVAKRCGIQIEVISGEEEARLVHCAVAASFNFKDRLALLVDIGGGSVELTVASQQHILATDCHKLGTVRLLQMLEQGGQDIRRFSRMVREYTTSAARRIRKEVGNRDLEWLIGTGGNCEALGELCRNALGRDYDNKITVQDLGQLVEMLQSMNFRQRVLILRMRSDRADVILPAAIVLQTLMHITGLDALHIPRVGVKNGILFDLLSERKSALEALHYRDVTEAAERLLRKFDCDEKHARCVAVFAVKLFDDLRALHGLEGPEYRMVLEVAALLHETGQFISPVGYHKHSLYVLKHNPVLGLSQSQMNMVANLARYHRKSMPREKHEEFAALTDKQRTVLLKLIPLLRLATAFDQERTQQVADFTARVENGVLMLGLQGEGDLYLETWAVTQHREALKDCYGASLEVSCNGTTAKTL